MRQQLVRLMITLDEGIEDRDLSCAAPVFGAGLGRSEHQRESDEQDATTPRLQHDNLPKQ